MKKKGFVALIRVVAFLYIVSPIGVIPDPFPVVGWVDGVAVGVGSDDKPLLVNIVPGLADETPRLSGLDVFF